MERGRPDRCRSFHAATRDVGLRIGMPSGTGFTLAELLAVIVVIVIVVAIAVPGAWGPTASHRLDEQVYSVSTQLTDARARAAAERRDYRFRVEGGGRYWIEVKDSGWQTVRGPVSLPSGMWIELEGASGGFVLFHPSGHAAAPATIRIGSSDRSRSVRVFGSGLVQVERGRE